ncbi:hypothetical protein DPSP01_003710 [Paraphaeosphaeria sporulosa]|uniref:Uncharacterized protein n=1 Tax=Paraphaeosphaeria sporulosa TaxID=1460663 RepID=A0A177CRH9_9PLEO|nr:uncharacterized protein CC84DRAFT_1213271 [Paraphaeosphaeria sporulosa]OAG09896.1 hypothetical protein CC84DRAFT_1213271 [Paraphaeosphaeria sporulosa]
MEHAVAAKYADAMEYLELPESVKGRKCRVPRSVWNPTGSDFHHDTVEGSSRRQRARKNLNAYVADEEEEMAREVGLDVCIAHETAGLNEEAAHIPMTAEVERIPTPYITARSTPIGTKPERVPTPMPFALGQYTKRQGNKHINPFSDGERQYSTSPARLERISSSSPLQLDLFPSPPRSFSVLEGKGKGNAPALPSPEEIDRWRPLSISSIGTATPLHPGIRTPLAARYSPLHNKATRERQLSNIDSVISPYPVPCPGIEDVSSLCFGNFFASRVQPRSPAYEEGVGNASSTSSEQFYKLPEYTGSSNTDLIRPRRRQQDPVGIKPLDLELSSLDVELRSQGSPVSEVLVGSPPVSEALTGDFELEEVITFQEWNEAQKREDRFERSFLGKARSLYRKIRGKFGGGDDDEEESGVERRGVLGQLKSKVARMGAVRGKLFRRAKEV